MPLRQRTKLDYVIAAQRARAHLDLAPTASLSEVARWTLQSERNLQRAFRHRGTTFNQERRGRQLDRAARVLLDQGGRGQRAALANAGLAAGGWQGASHEVWKRRGMTAAVPRHSEVSTGVVRRVCRALHIPLPPRK